MTVSPTLRRWTAITSVAGPLLFVADNIVHPREFATGHEARQLSEIAGHSDRWQIAHALGAGTLAIGAMFLVCLYLLVREASPATTAVGLTLALTGVLANAFLLALDGFTWGTLGEVSGRSGVDQPTLQTALGAVQNSGWLTPYHLAAGLIPIGTALTLYVAYRVRELGPAEIGVYAVSMVFLSLESAIHSNTYFISTALVYLLAGVLIARRVLRKSA